MKGENNRQFERQSKEKDQNLLKELEKEKSLEQLENWLQNFQIPVLNKFYTEKQILELREFIEISQQIKLRKRSQGKKLYLFCENYEVCSYKMTFQLKKSRKQSQIFFKLVKFQKYHPESKQHNGCFLPIQQFELNRRKKYLQLLIPYLSKLISNSEQQLIDKSPSQILEKFQRNKKLKPSYLFEGLDSSSRRQLKKKFDNLIASIKKSILLSNKKIQENQIEEMSLPKMKSKKNQKPKKSKSSKRQKRPKKNPKILQQNSLMKFYESESSDKDESLMKEIQFRQKLEIKLEQKQKEQNHNFITPTKKKNFLNFDLEKSSSKRPTQFVISYHEHLFTKSHEKGQSMEAQSQRKSLSKYKKQSQNKQKSRKSLFSRFFCQQ